MDSVPQPEMIGAATNEWTTQKAQCLDSNLAIWRDPFAASVDTHKVQHPEAASTVDKALQAYATAGTPQSFLAFQVSLLSLAKQVRAWIVADKATNFYTHFKVDWTKEQWKDDYCCVLTNSMGIAVLVDKRAS